MITCFRCKYETECGEYGAAHKDYQSGNHNY